MSELKQNQTPFVKLFLSPKGFYVFDVNSNQIFEINKEEYTFLEKCLQGIECLASEKAPEKLQHLQSLGYFSSNRVKHVEVSSPQESNFAVERAIRKLTLQITQNCNLRCKYCVYSGNPKMHQRSHTNRIMPVETAKKAIDFLYEHSIDSPEVNIGFYGGEPLLHFSLIKELVAYVNEIFFGKKVTYNMTTNGTLLTENMIEFFCENKIAVTVSLDGPKEIHDKNRVFKNGVGSFDTVIGKLTYFIKKFPEFCNFLTLHMVVDPRNDYDLVYGFDPESIGLPKYKLSCSMVELGDDDFAMKSEEDRKKIDDFNSHADYFHFLVLLARLNVYKVSNLPGSYLQLYNAIRRQEETFEPTTPLLPIAIPSGPCIPGQSRLFVSVDGTFYPCERVSETSDVMKIGDINSGFNYSKISTLENVGSITEDACRNCWAFRHCSLCARCADGGTELRADAKRRWCATSIFSAQDKISNIICLRSVPTKYSSELRRSVKLNG